jgi:hypothetical protein
MDKNTQTTFTLSEVELTELLKNAFYHGALSHSNFSGQPDTCWSNVHLDMIEEAESIINGLKTN